MTHNRTILMKMLRIEANDGIGFHFALGNDQYTCEFLDRDGKIVHTGTGVTEDAAFMAAEKTWNPNKAKDELNSLETANTEMAEKIRSLEQQLQTEKAAKSTGEDGFDSMPAEEPSAKPPVAKKKKKTYRRKTDSLGL